MGTVLENSKEQIKTGFWKVTDEARSEVGLAAPRHVPGRSESGKDRYKSKKRFGYRVRESKARPTNMSVRDPLPDSRYTEAVLSFLEATEGVICR